MTWISHTKGIKVLVKLSNTRGGGASLSSFFFSFSKRLPLRCHYSRHERGKKKYRKIFSPWSRDYWRDDSHSHNRFKKKKETDESKGVGGPSIKPSSIFGPKSSTERNDDRRKESGIHINPIWFNNLRWHFFLKVWRQGTSVARPLFETFFRTLARWRN